MRCWRRAARRASWRVEAELAHARLDGWLGCGGEGHNLHPSACARAGWHEQCVLLVCSRHGNALGLICTATHCRLLGSCRVVMEGFGKVMLEMGDIVTVEGE